MPTNGYSATVYDFNELGLTTPGFVSGYIGQTFTITTGSFGGGFNDTPSETLSWTDDDTVMEDSTPTDPNGTLPGQSYDSNEIVTDFTGGSFPDGQDLASLATITFVGSDGSIVIGHPMVVHNSSNATDLSPLDGAGNVYSNYYILFETPPNPNVEYTATAATIDGNFDQTPFSTGPIVTNTPPEDEDEFDTFEEGSTTPIDTDVLANSSDVDGDTVTIVPGTVVTNGPGTVSVSGGVVTYTPDGTETEGDVIRIKYQVEDGNGGFNESSVYITVEAAGVDTDGDGVNDDVDLDDDNDGILDTDECPMDNGIVRTEGLTYDTKVSTVETETHWVENPEASDGSLQFNIDVDYPNLTPGTGTASYVISYDGVEYVRFETTDPNLPPVVTLSNGATMSPANLTPGSTTNLEVGIPVTTDGTLQIVTETPSAWAAGGGNTDFYGDSNATVVSANIVDMDFDNDGIDNCLDLDSDNDGISDLEESGANSAVHDPDNNGTIDGAQFVDANNNGLADAIEAINGVNQGTNPQDTDGNGDANYLDLDSDNDGISDFIEGQATDDFVTYDNTDSDGDGVIDIVDSTPGFGGDFYEPTNTDGTGQADYMDTDSDDDGILDINESGLTTTGVSNNGIDNGSNVTINDQDGDINTSNLTDGSVLLNADSDAAEPDFRSIPCFTAGTMIQTEAGEVAVEKLSQGDMVLTQDNGYQQIRWIGIQGLTSAELEQHGNLAPIRIRAGALGKNIPDRELMVSPQHRVLIRSKAAERMFGRAEVLVAAKHLISIQGIDVATDVQTVEYVHFMFDEHQVVYSNGAETESLYTGEVAMRSIAPESRQEILKLFPLLGDVDYKATACRKLVSGRMGRKLATRHKANNKILVSARMQ